MIVLLRVVVVVVGVVLLIPWRSSFSIDLDRCGFLHFALTILFRNGFGFYPIAGSRRTSLSIAPQIQ